MSKEIVTDVILLSEKVKIYLFTNELSLEYSIKFLSVYHQSFGKTFFQFILLPLLNNFPSFTPSKLKIKMMMHNVQILLWWFKRICFYRCYCFKVCKTNIDIFLKFYFQIFLSDLVQLKKKFGNYLHLSMSRISFFFFVFYFYNCLIHLYKILQQIVIQSNTTFL